MGADLGAPGGDEGERVLALGQVGIQGEAGVVLSERIDNALFARRHPRRPSVKSGLLATALPRASFRESDSARAEVTAVQIVNAMMRLRDVMGEPPYCIMAISSYKKSENKIGVGVFIARITCLLFRCWSGTSEPLPDEPTAYQCYNSSAGSFGPEREVRYSSRLDEPLHESGECAGE